MKQLQDPNLIAFFLLLLTFTNSCFALCNNADAIMCCLNTGAANDPLIALQLLLSGVKAPTPDTIVGVGCTPITNANSAWYVTYISMCRERENRLIAINYYAVSLENLSDAMITLMVRPFILNCTLLIIVISVCNIGLIGLGCGLQLQKAATT